MESNQKGQKNTDPIVGSENTRYIKGGIKVIVVRIKKGQTKSPLNEQFNGIMENFSARVNFKFISSIESFIST